MQYTILLFIITIVTAQNKNYLQVLGVAQDAGYPQAACEKECCKLYWQGKTDQKFATSLALIINNRNYYLFEASPDVKFQLQQVKTINSEIDIIPSGIFLTHAHIGHYTGLIHFGREVIGSKSIPVYAMPKMKAFLENNGPWSQLVKLNNIQLQNIRNRPIGINKNITIKAFPVPHRDEFSETVGYEIVSDKKKILFIPDINKWDLWEKSIVERVRAVDIAFLDASFFQNGEIKNRDMSEIPHPFIAETMALFENETKLTKSKIYFIHFNHTNPILFNEQKRKDLRKKGYNIAEEGMTISL